MVTEDLQPETNYGCITNLYILIIILIYYTNLKLLLILVHVDNFHEEVTIFKIEDQLMLDDQQDSINSNTDSVAGKSSNWSILSVYWVLIIHLNILKLIIKGIFYLTYYIFIYLLVE